MKKLSSFRKAIVLFAAVLTGIVSLQAATQIAPGVTLISPSSGSTYYSSIQAAYNAVDFGAAAGAYSIEIGALYDVANETFPITLGAKAGASSTNTITIKPATGAAIVIANPTVTATVNKTIVFDGASYVTIDGVARTGATTLTIQNPNTESAHTIFFTNGAVNNTVKNCFIKGTSATKGAASINNAVIYFDAQANIGNKIEDNDICDIDGLAKPVTMILLNNSGASAAEYNTIQNNKIYNYNYVATTLNGVPAAVHVMGASANARILSNKIYWTGTIADTKAALYGITFDATSIGAESRVEGNVIGGTAADNSGTATFNIAGNFTPINVNLNSTVKTNVIKNMTFTTTGTNGYMINIAANGTGLADADAWTGNTVANIDMTYTGTTTNALSGMYITQTAATPGRNISNNTFYGLKLKSTGNYTTIIRVIFVNSTAIPTALWSYSGNTIYDIHCDETTETSTHGVVCIDTRANTSVIEKNLIYNLKSSNTGSKETIFHALRMNGNNASGTTIKNNVISIGNGINSNAQIRGIVHTGSGTAGQVVNIFHNTIFIGGSQSNTTPVFTAISSAFYRDGSIIPNITLKNNIFVVKRTTTLPVDEPLSAIFLATAVSNLATSDNNILIAPVCVRINTGSVSYVTLANWRTATTNTKDMNSSDVDPGFADESSATPDLHITSPNSSANSKGDATVPVTDDFAGALRANYTPSDMGAYVIAGSTFVENVNNVNRNILAQSKAIQFNNLSGRTINVYTLSGQLVKTKNLKADNEKISVNPGLYIVKADGQNVKVLVK